MKLGIKANWSRTAPTVLTLEARGYSYTGTHSMETGAVGGLGINGSTLVNPLDPTLCPGGSSTGSALALHHKLCDLALVSDTTGSARVPAAFCNLVGYKPTNALWSTQGLDPLSSTLDSTAFMARDIGTISGLVAPSAAEYQHPRVIYTLDNLAEIDSFVHKIFLYEMSAIRSTSALIERYRSKKPTETQYTKALQDLKDWRTSTLDRYFGEPTVLVTQITQLNQTPTLEQAVGDYDSLIARAMYWTRIANILQGPSIALGQHNILLTAAPNQDAMLLDYAENKCQGSLENRKVNANRM